MPTDPKSLFTRQHNRTAEDVFNKFIAPELQVLASDIGQKLIHDAKHTHGFENRTGALEDSMRWNVLNEVGKTSVEVMAGGYGRVQFPKRDSSRLTKQKGLTATGKTRQIRRRGKVVTDLDPFEQSERRGLKKGEVILVNYAKFVEMKGYSVLIESVNRFRERIPRMMRAFLSGKTARI